jgi:Methyltransferase domain
MTFMKAILRRVTPQSVRMVYGTVRTHRRALEKDERLIALAVGQEPSQFASACQLVPDRRVLLEKLPRGGIVAEVGVAHGDFSAEILTVCQPAELHLIDLWRGSETRRGKVGGVAGLAIVRERFAREIAAGIVQLRQGFSAEELARSPDKFFDWVYIDAAHDYDHVRLDLEVAVAKVRESGYICGDDYTRWGSKGLTRFGVVEAVNEFCLKYGWEMVYLTNEPHRHLSYALRVRR